MTRFVGAAAAAWLSTFLISESRAQTQSLAFTGGVLLNTKVRFGNLGSHMSAARPGPQEGSAVDRTYDNGFNRVDATGNDGQTTVNYGYQSAAQLDVDSLRLTAASAAGDQSVDDAEDSIQPSGNLEYRGSLGPLGSSDWGVLLGVGYQAASGEESRSFITDATFLEDAFTLGGVPPGSLPPPPFAGSPDADVPRIGSEPSRSVFAMPGERLLNGTWELDANLFPFTGGVYLESQIVGRLNVVASAGVLAMLVDAEFKYHETSAIRSLAPVISKDSEETYDFLFGGFVQLSLDWALWEDASLVAGARWQPAETFRHSVDGRAAEIDFTTSFAVHAGFSMRF